MENIVKVKNKDIMNLETSSTYSKMQYKSSKIIDATSNGIAIRIKYIILGTNL